MHTHSLSLYTVCGFYFYSLMFQFPGVRKHSKTCMYLLKHAGDIAFRFINYVRSARERQLQRKLKHHQNLSWQEISESYQEDKFKSLGDSHVVVCDINKEMLKVGKEKAQHLGYSEGKSCIVPLQ